MFIRNFIFLLIITIIQIYLTSSTEEKCYSIKNCEICSELDTCDKCIEGFKINESKTKCKAKEKKEKKVKPKKEKTKTIKKETQPAPAPAPPAQPAKPSPSPVNNPFLQKADISVNKVPNNPFQNIPTPSFQKFKDKEANNALINKILIFILIVLVLSIIVSVINNFLKKNKNKGYSDDEGMDETSKVVSIH